MSRISRRDFLRGASLLTTGAVLAACTSEKATSTPEIAVEEPVSEPAQPEGTLIQYWVGWGGSYAGQTWDLLKETDEFKEALGNNEFEIKGSVATEAFLTAIAAGTPPDGAANIQYLDYMARGVCRAIDDYVAASTVLKKEDYLADSWDLAFYEGKMYGAPANEGFLRYGLNYNARMVEAAGLDPDNPPLTWDACLEWHKALTKFDDAGNLLQIGLDPYDAMGGGLWISDGFYVPLAWGFEWFNEDTGKFNLDNDLMIDALEAMGEFVKLIGPDNLAGLRSVEGHGTWGGSFNAEIQAMIIEGYWHPGETAVEKPEILQYNRATWAPVPESRKGAKIQATGGHFVLFFKEGKNPAGMFKISEFLNSDKACDIIFENTGWLPGRIPYIQNADPSAYPGLDFYFKAVDETTDWQRIARCPITEFVDTEFRLAYEGQFRGEVSAAEAVAELQKRCEEEYEAAGFG